MRVIGMISGTSFDAVEAVLADLELAGDDLVCDLLEHRSLPYPGELRDAIAGMLPPAATRIEQVCRLDVLLGRHFAEVAAELADAHGGVDAVCSHGQTVFHWVKGAHAYGCVQLGQPAFIAERTGATVVSDVRNRDIAAGGQGAPLASLLDVLLLGRHRERPAGALNLGGIANVTVVDRERAPLAFDIGPANALLDAAVSWRSGGRRHADLDGAWAAAGQVDTSLVAALLDDPYFDLAPPKSTGKELFHLGYLTDRLGARELSNEDLLASVTSASAEIVARGLRPHRLSEVYVSGGGTRNPELMRRLAALVEGVPLRRYDELGVREDAKEALVFAVVGFLTLHGLPATVPSCTGAAHPSVLGSITPGARPLALAAGIAGAGGAAAAPGRLVVRTALPAAAAVP